MGVYVFDTNVIISLGWQSYPADRFPRVHAWVDSMVELGRVITPTEVRRELEKHQNEAFAWLKSREARVVQPHDVNVQLYARSVIREFEPPEGVEIPERVRKFIFGADPFVLGLAYVTGATIVTNETKGGGPANPKIPMIAAARKIESLNFFELMEKEGVTF